MFAIIATGGKQLNVEVGKEYFIEKVTGNVDDKVIFDQVLMIDNNVGKPMIKGAQVHGVILKQDKAKKIVVFKYKPKKNSKTKYGHRQPYTKVKITDILLDGKKSETKENKIVKETAKPAEKKVATTATTKQSAKPAEKKVVAAKTTKQ